MIDHEVIGEIAGHRRTLLRMVVMYAPLTAGAGTLALVSLSAFLGGSYGAVVPLLILLLVTGAALIQLISALRDLQARPTFTRGQIRRLWTKGGLLWFFRSHYLMIDRQVFVIAPEVWVQLDDEDIVELHHWPHTRTLIRALLLKGDSGDLDNLVAGEPVSPPTEA